MFIHNLFNIDNLIFAQNIATSHISCSIVVVLVAWRSTKKSSYVVLSIREIFIPLKPKLPIIVI